MSSDSNIAYCEHVRYWTYGAGQAVEHVEPKDCPVIFMDRAEEFHGGSILAGKGKGALRDFARSLIKWPATDSPEGQKLSESVAELVSWWQDEISDGGLDPASVEDATGYTEADRMVIGWIRDGELPGFRDMCFQLAWPFFLRQCTEAADRYQLGAEERAEAEEVAEYRVQRWLEATKPFSSTDWLPRAAMFAAYRDWCRMDGSADKIGREHDFYVTLKELGCTEAKRRGDRGFSAPKGGRG